MSTTESMTLSVLELGGTTVRHREAKDGEMVFLLLDVCKVLGFNNPSQAVSDHVDARDTTRIRNPDFNGSRGSKRWAIWINETAVNCLIFGSRLPSARKYTRTVAAFVAKVRRGEIQFAHTQDLATRVAAFIAEKTQEWELTFGKKYYGELDRLSGYKRTHPNRHPPIYGQVTDKIYKLLDADIADRLRVLIPHPTKGGPKRHQGYTAFGKKELHRVLQGEIIRMEMCSTLGEYMWYLEEKIANQQRLPFRLVNTKREAARLG